MARIPLQIASRTLDTGNVVQVPTGSPVGQAVERAGSQIAGVAEAALDRQVREQRFDAYSRMSTLTAELQGDLAKLQHETANPSGLTTTFNQDYLDSKGKAFVSSLPAGVKSEFGARWETQRQQLLNQASRTEYVAREKYETSQIGQRVSAASDAIRQNPSLLPEWEADIDGAISSGAMSATGKEASRLAAREALATAAAEGEIAINPALARRKLGFGSPLEQAMQLIASKEGFSSGAYWDVNAFRAGFGSDTITDAQGAVRRVQQGDTVTEADAMRDLRRRTGITLDQVRSSIGDEAFDRLTASQKVALASTTYNYGRLPESVASAARGGDADAIAASIEGLQFHNNGVNRDRRLAEAEYSRSGSAVVPQYASIPYQKRLDLARKASMADAQVKFETRQAVTDDLASIEKTGQGSTNLDPQQVRGALGDDQYRQWQAKRTVAKGVWDATNDMAQLPDDVNAARVNSLMPVAGEQNFATKQAVFDAAHKRATELEKMRRDDPAQSVADIPEVRNVLKSVKQGDPVSTQKAVGVSLAAQAAAGIPDALQSPITRNDAQRLAAPLVVVSRTTGRDTVTREERTVLEGVVKTVANLYGPYADKVLPRVIEEGIKDRQFGPLATSIMKKMAASQPLTPRDLANVESAADAGNGTQAMKAVSVQSSRPVPGYGAIQHLIANPDLAPQFDQKYGAGYAARLLQARP